MTTNFLQFDPSKNNLLSDAFWVLNAFRVQGAVKGKASAAAFNKLSYQTSTMVTAIAQMMEAKGYDIQDTSLTVLAEELAHIMTEADMSVYALGSQLAGYIAKAAVVHKTTDYALLVSDFYKTIQFDGAVTPGTFTLPIIGDVPSGAWVKIKNASSGALATLAIDGEIDGSTSVVLQMNDEIVIYSDGAAFRGKVVTSSSGAVPTGGGENDKLYVASDGTTREWANGFDMELISRAMNAASGLVSYTNCSFKPSAVVVLSYASGMSYGGTNIGIGVSNMVSQFCASMMTYNADEETSGGRTDSDSVIYIGGAGGNQKGAIVEILANGVKINWTLTGGESGTMVGAILYFR